MAREVGTEGKLGGQAQVPGRRRHLERFDRHRERDGANLTEQVRGIARVVTAVANGDLKQTSPSRARARSRRWPDTINNMTSTLATFAEAGDDRGA